jgi:hypothetical protein
MTVDFFLLTGRHFFTSRLNFNTVLKIPVANIRLAQMYQIGTANNLIESLRLGVYFWKLAKGWGCNCLSFHDTISQKEV